MSTEEPQPAGSTSVDTDATMQDVPGDGAAAEPSAAPSGRKRPRIDIKALGVGTGERKRGKSMFGVLLNTLNKAKAEDKERNASEAAKKRQLIEQRLQNKLRKETDSVRLAEEAKKDKVTANRKEEDLQLKDSIHKLRRTRLPHLSNFLSTSDVVPRESDSDEPDSSFQLSSLLPPRAHPPPLYYLPAVLTPAQESFLTKRKAQVNEAAEKEWEEFKSDRTSGIDEIMALRKKAQAYEETKSAEKRENGTAEPQSAVEESGQESRGGEAKGVEMDLDSSVKEDRERELEKKSERPSGTGNGAGGDDDDAVEY